jgi:carbon storage regulator
MLVIRRREGESLLIGENVELEVLELSSGHVKLGIRAPRQIQILRKEVQVTSWQNRAAAQAAQPGAVAALSRIFSPRR